MAIRPRPDGQIFLLNSSVGVGQAVGGVLNRIDLASDKASVNFMSKRSKAVDIPTAGIPAPTLRLSNEAKRRDRLAPTPQSPADRSLDQWRGLALVLVLISHAFHYPDRVPGVGRAGVNLFFFISGILVYRSLDRGPRGATAGALYFWTRRTKRLVPAKYFYLLCAAGFVACAPRSLVPASFASSFYHGLPSSFLYYRNYYAPSFSGVSPVTGLNENLAGHLWSLACEMQFYLLAPVIFSLGGQSTPRRFAVFGTVLALMLAGGLSVIGRTDYNPYSFQVAAWPMMAGFVVEFLRATFPRHGAGWGKPLTCVGLASLVVMALAIGSKLPGLYRPQADGGVRRRLSCRRTAWVVISKASPRVAFSATPSTFSATALTPSISGSNP